MTMPWVHLACAGVLISSLALSACADTNEPSDTDAEAPAGELEPGIPPGGPVSTPPGGIGTEVEGLPETRQDTILLEGMPEPVTVKLYATPPDFPLPFYTYYPEDLVAQRIMEGDYGETIRFTANMGGTLQDDAFVQFYMLPAGVTEEDARVMTRSNAEEHGTVRQRDQRRFPWSIEEYAIEERNLVGTLALARHGNRYFQLFVAYPPEYGDGFGPRADVVLDEWRWLDTGTPLNAE